VSDQVLHLQPEVGAARSARAALSRWLERDGVAHLGDEILLVAGELVTNAVVHAATTMDLVYSCRARTVEVAVDDHDPRLPRLVRGPGAELLANDDPAPALMGGRGLMIVSRVADEWGVTPRPHGKRVWARWSIPP
jgi:anti-sigma regulatory factor (Ser/Thr protein kinase)